MYYLDTSHSLEHLLLVSRKCMHSTDNVHERDSMFVIEITVNTKKSYSCQYLSTTNLSRKKKKKKSLLKHVHKFVGIQ